MRLWIDLFFQWFQGMAGFLDGVSSASVFIFSDHLAGISFDFPKMRRPISPHTAFSMFSHGRFWIGLIFQCFWGIAS